MKIGLTDLEVAALVTFEKVWKGLAGRPGLADIDREEACIRFCDLYTRVQQRYGASPPKDEQEALKIFLDEAAKGIQQEEPEKGPKFDNHVQFFRGKEVEGIPRYLPTSAWADVRKRGTKEMEMVQATAVETTYENLAAEMEEDHAPGWAHRVRELGRANEAQKQGIEEAMEVISDLRKDVVANFQLGASRHPAEVVGIAMDAMVEIGRRLGVQDDNS